MKRFVGLCFVLFFIICLIWGRDGSVIFNYVYALSDRVKVLENDCDYKVVKIDKNCVEKLMRELNLEIVNRSCFEDRVIIEGYTNKISDYIIIDNNKINIQISISTDDCLVGCPLIKNSF